MYAVKQDIIDRYGDDALLVVTDIDGNIDEQAITRALNDATDEINTHIGKRYPLPLADVPRVLNRLAVDISIYRMADQADGWTEEKRQRYDDAAALLKAIASGKASLGLESASTGTDDGGSNTSPVGEQVEMTSQPRQMTRTPLNNVL